ncbi:acetyl/propionyl/methylcrotonyl-CoA carboxylase subunit alpha [Alloalcanivorax xenomutans]|uniref:acetyl/propionyl/methylcrotonyl-CoA carboxylase subunit alpha n=1 Tax=Alloalcanivorax xenomutans TaxID=1094342 RepID=UPI002931D442|nr:acetyl-CoA carboxylase biotin carboxylase subunit [Alloalcanivorax xenomutans]WOA31942.1 acetyl-CoA carboxylase biotin carboxylase subunit [Alloalcanivorax xenomutans]
MSKATPFSKILIANRGEIALRIQRSARELGYRTVAVYSSADRDARHVLEADQAVCIGEALPAQSYLNIDRIVDAARRAGADAVHPGYGFLAENPALAKACADAGLVFIGPSAEAIEAMGHKARAKQLMEQAGVPCVPGYQGQDQSEQRLHREADDIGYPVMIKATAGGGGRGMRLVESTDTFLEALASARSEAQSAFGDPEVILEKAIVEPRHVEIQVVADRHGKALHFGERDCSVQRRHQKVVEEAPSPAVDQALREQMGETAVRAVRAIGYEGAGTLEFLLDGEGRFYFMEMNTRLQVEHPVTEAITGVDLVALQLRVAAGEALALEQDDIRFRGHAIEVRLCAESPRQGFMPQSGTLVRWRAPRTLRVDSALRDGAEVPPFYDSMVAKLIAWGENRDEARRRLATGLEELVALGVETNQGFLARCLRDPVFAAGEATTAFVEQRQADLLHQDEEHGQQLRALAAALLYLTDSGAGSARSGLSSRLPLIVRYQLRDEDGAATLTRLRANRLQVVIEDVATEFGLLGFTADGVRLERGGVVETVPLARRGDVLHFLHGGEGYSVTDRTYAAAAQGAADGGDGRVRASMNGRLVSVAVSEGQRVEAGEAVLTLEAMKMEHVHRAGVGGVVSVISAAEGDQVAAGRVLVEIEADASEENKPE